MQITHQCNGAGLPDFPAEDIATKDVNVWMHDSGMFATHDYSCPCCRENHAILQLNNGVMQTCKRCQKLGYRVVKLDNWFKRWLLID